MSSHNRPWYKWYPRDFNQDEKVKGLGWDAELIYRRILDVMWQSNDCQLPNDIDYLHNAVAIAIPKNQFATAWLQIQRENFELFVEKNGWIYSERLKQEMKDVYKLSNTRKKLGSKGGIAKAKAIAKQKLYQKGSDTETDTEYKDIYSAVVKYLNKELGTKYKATSNETKKHIRARLNEGYVQDEFFIVIDNQIAEWKGNDKMQKYLRPKTLFGTNFESYLQTQPVKLKSHMPRN